MTNNNTPDLRAVLIEARDWFESQAKAVSKGCGSSYELHDLRTQRDALDEAVASPDPTTPQFLVSDLLRAALRETEACLEMGDVFPGLLKVVKRALAAPAQAVPASIITASVMRDDGGEHPAFCLMVAYRAEKDAMTALAMLTDEPAQAAAPTLGGYTHADVTAAPAKPVAWALKWPGDDRLNLSTVFDTKAEATEYLHRCQAGVTVIPLYDSPQLAAATVTATPVQAGEYPELPEAMFAKDVASFDPVYLPDDMHAYADATCAARGAAQVSAVESNTAGATNKLKIEGGSDDEQD